MKVAGVLLGTIIALALQTTVTPFIFAGKGNIDLVLVVIVYAALQFGPATGLLTGAAAGLAQDVLSGGVLGVGSLAKTLVGFLAGVIGSQFIVSNIFPRFIVLLGGAALNAVVSLGMNSVIDRRGWDLPWRTAWPQVLLTAVVGIILIQAVHAVPGMMMRRRLRRGY